MRIGVWNILFMYNLGKFLYRFVNLVFNEVEIGRLLDFIDW